MSIKNNIFLNEVEEGNYDRDEIYKILDIAEEYQKQYEKYSDKLRLYRIIQFAMPVFVIIVIGASLINNFNSFNSTNSLLFYISLFVVFFLLNIFIIEILIIKRLKQQIQFLRRSIYETIEIIREVIEIKFREKGSYLEKLEFKLRLSRFGIG